MKLHHLTFFLVLGAAILLGNSCYYDNEEKLYEGYLAACDTTGITFSKDIKPILALNCDNCHGTATAPVLGAGINLDGPARIALYETQFPGRFFGSISHVRPYSPMPKGGRKLDDCSLAKIDAWIKSGLPDN